MQKKLKLGLLTTPVAAISLIASVVVPLSLSNLNNGSQNVSLAKNYARQIPTSIYSRFSSLFQNLAPDFNTFSNSPLSSFAETIGYINSNFSAQDVFVANSNQSNPPFVDFIEEYNANQPQGWVLNLAGSWSDLDLQLLSVFSYFTNIETIVISIEGSNPSSYDFGSISNLSWTSELRILDQLVFELSFEDGYSGSGTFDLDSFDFISDTGVTSINFSSLAGQRIFTNQFSNQEWFHSRGVGFELLLPTNYSIATETQNIATFTSSFTSEGITVIKNSLPSIQNPSFNNNEELLLNGTTAYPLLVDNEWYWAYEQGVNSFNQVLYKSENSNFYTTTQSIGFPQVVSPSFFNYGNDVESNLLDNRISIPTNLQLDSITPSEEVNRIVVIDGVEYGTFLQDSTIYIDYPNVTSIQYGTSSGDNLEFFTTDELAQNASNRAIVSSTNNQGSGTTTVIDSPNFVTVSIADPISFDSLINYETISIEPLVNEGTFYWNFLDGGVSLVDVADAKYYSSSLRTIYYDERSLDNLASFPTDIRTITEGSTVVLSDADRVEFSDIGEINATNSSQINDQVTVDGVTYGQVVRQGNLYWDLDISTIRYRYFDGASFVYFTSQQEMQDSIGSIPDYLQNVVEVNRVRFREIPAPIAISNPALSNSIDSILIDGFTLNYTIRSGEAYWDFDSLNLNINLEDVQYVDRNGNFFTSFPTITENSEIPPSLSEVISASSTIIPEPTYSIYFDPEIRISSDTYETFAAGIIVNNVQYFPRYVDSIARWPDTMPIPKYIVDFADGESNRFYSEEALSTLPNSVLQQLSEITNSDNVSTYSELSIFDTILDPVNEVDSLVVFLVDGTIVTITTQFYNGDLVWNSTDYINRLEFKITLEDGSSAYSSIISQSIVDSAANIESLGDIEITDNLVDNDLNIEWIRTQGNNSSIEIVIYSVIGSIVGIVAILLITRTIIIIRRNKSKG